MKQKLKDLLKNKKNKSTYTDIDMEEIYWLGVEVTMRELKHKCYSYPIGGVAVPALTDTDLDDILREIEARERGI